MLQRLMAQLVWPLIVALVLNGVAGVCLATLKLAGVIGGSWLWILSPLWVPVAVAMVLELILLQMAWAESLSAQAQPARAQRHF